MSSPTVRVDEAGLDAAVAALLGGQPIVVPTDTVYGLAVIAGDPVALDRVFELKRRPPDRSIAVLVAGLDQAVTIGTFGERARMVALRHWPGGLTLVVDRLDGVDPSIGRADGTVGIRCPDEEFVRKLATRVGPLATTSANLSGEPTPAEAIEAAARLDGSVALIVDDGPRHGRASTVARIDDDGSVVVFREGAIGERELRTASGR